MSTPAVPDPPGSVYSRFPLDPRSSGDLRASDADREIARDILAEAFADGQLTHDEYNDRLDGALQAHHLGQLVPLIGDLALHQDRGTVRRAQRPGDRAAGKPSGLAGAVRTAVFVVGVTNLVWLWTSISSGALLYYWPMWPALGMAIMLLATMVSDKSGRRPDQIPGRDDMPPGL